MKELFKEKFALTEQGAKDLLKSSIITFFNYLITMLPTILLMLFLEELIFINIRNKSLYFLASFIVIIIIYMSLSIEYNALYNTTFRESENLRIEVARTLSNLPLSYFSKHNLSDLAQTIMADVAAIEHALSHSIAKTIGFIAFFIFLSTLLIIENLKLGFIVVFPIFLNFIILIISKKIQIRNQAKYYNKLRENTESFQETIELQQEIQSFGLGNETKNKLYNKMDEGEKIHIKSEFYVGILINLVSIILYLSLIGIIIVGSKMLLNDEINILYFIGYLLAGMKLKDNADSISLSIAEIFYIDAMIDRIKEIKKTEIQTGKEEELKKFDIEINNVSFSYNKDIDILKNISFTAKQGEVTALVGKSGCGKTTLLRLISRLYDYQSGSIKISGKNINEISTKSLFKKVSIVFQDVILFNTSILENIKIGNQNASDEEIKRAAVLANCEEFIEKLPEGYNTLIGENGARLSGGERQRISIARAFLKNAPIIILDEIAASLDIENEKKIQESLKKLIKDKTIIIISHRLKSIENADKIVVVENGRVEASGKHNELLNLSKTYKELIQSANLVENFCY